MAADINQVMLTGRLVRDVEIKAIGQAQLVTGSIAVNRTIKSDDGWKDIPNFIEFKNWIKSDKQVEFYRNNFKKGTKVVLNGELLQEQWEKDGQKHSKLTVNVNKIEFMGKNQNAMSNTSDSEKVPQYNGNLGFPEDIPF